MASANANDCVDQLLECTICMNEFTDPRVLPCGHTACLQCLKQHIGRHAVPGKKFLCHFCRQESVIPKGGVEAFVKNYVVTRIKDFLKGEREKGASSETSPVEETKVHSCQQCDETDDAEVFCMNCAEYLGPICHKTHQATGSTQTHSMVAVNDLQPGQVEQAKARVNFSKCDKHPGLPLEAYCSTCSTLICTTCSTTTHKDHPKESISHAAAKSKAVLTTTKASVTNYRRNLISMRNDLLILKDKIDNESDAARACVDEAVEEIFKLVTAQQNSLQLAITDHQHRAISDIVASVEKYDSQVDKVDSFLSMSDTLVSDLDHASHSPGLTQRMAVLQRDPLVTVGWSSDTTRRPCERLPVAEVIGNVKTNRTVVPASNPCGANASGGGENSESDNLGIPLSCNETVSGLVLLHNHIHVTHMSNGNIWVYSLDGDLIATVHVPQLDSPHGMTLVEGQSCELAITDYRMKTLHFLTLTNDHVINVHRKVALDFKPEDVNYDSHTKLLNVAGHAPERIVVMDTGGFIRKTIHLREVRSVRSVVGSHITGGYVVTDQSRRQVIWVDERGTVTKRYVGAAASMSLGKIFDVIQDDSRRVLVCDYDNSQVHLLSNDGTLVKHMLSPHQNFQKPTCIYLDEIHRCMYAAHDGLGSKMVSVFKYDPAPQAGTKAPVIIRRRLPASNTKVPTASTVLYRMKLQMNIF